MLQTSFARQDGGSWLRYGTAQQHLEVAKRCDIVTVRFRWSVVAQAARHSCKRKSGPEVLTGRAL